MNDIKTHLISNFLASLLSTPVEVVKRALVKELDGWKRLERAANVGVVFPADQCSHVHSSLNPSPVCSLIAHTQMCPALHIH